MWNPMLVIVTYGYYIWMICKCAYIGVLDLPKVMPPDADGSYLERIKYLRPVLFSSLIQPTPTSSAIFLPAKIRMIC